MTDWFQDDGSRENLVRAIRLINKARGGDGSDDEARGGHLLEAVEVLQRCGLDPQGRPGKAGGGSMDRLSDLTEWCETLLDQPSRRLVVYGTLAPGEVNHHMIADVPGRWEDGFVRGILGRVGPYPGFRWDNDGERYAARLFHSEHLGRHWERLDCFEGPSYRRILCTIETAGGTLLAANVYEARKLD